MDTDSNHEHKTPFVSEGAHKTQEQMLDLEWVLEHLRMCVHQHSTLNVQERGESDVHNHSPLWPGTGLGHL